MVDYVSDSIELLRRVRAIAFLGDLPDDLKQKLQMLPGSPADNVTDTAEILYANYDRIGDDAKRVMAEVYNHADKQGWLTFNQGTRSKEIVAIVARDLGEKGTTVAKKSAVPPAPDTRRRDGVDWRSPTEPSPEPDAT